MQTPPVTPEEAEQLMAEHNSEPCLPCLHEETVTYTITGEKPCIKCGIDTNTGKPIGWA